MKTIVNIKKIALLFFIVTGFIHLGASVFIANQLFIKEATIAHKVMDIPFIITGVIYGLSTLRLNFTDPEKKHKTLDISLAGLTILILIALVVVNLLIPDLPLNT